MKVKFLFWKPMLIFLLETTQNRDPMAIRKISPVNQGPRHRAVPVLPLVGVVFHPHLLGLPHPLVAGERGERRDDAIQVNPMDEVDTLSHLPFPMLKLARSALTHDVPEKNHFAELQALNLGSIGRNAMALLSGIGRVNQVPLLYLVTIGMNRNVVMKTTLCWYDSLTPTLSMKFPNLSIALTDLTKLITQATWLLWLVIGCYGWVVWD